MTLCPEEKLLEAYGLGQMNNPAREIRIGTHINNCHLCRLFIENLRCFRIETELISSGQIDRMSGSLIESIRKQKPSRTLILRPCSGPEGTINYCLAAESETLPRYVNVQSFTDTEEEVVARIIRDRQTEHLVLYLIASDTDRFKDTQLQIDGFPGTYFLDEQARTILPEGGKPNLTRAAIHLKTPIRSYDLSPVQDLKETILAHGHYLVSSSSLDRIHIEMDAGESQKKVKICIVKLDGRSGEHEVEVIVIQKGNRILTSTTRQGVAVFEDLDPDSILHIRIY